MGKHGLLHLIRAVPLGDEPAFIQALLQTIAKLNAENLTTDDVSVLLFKLNGAAPSVPWKTRLLAPCRVLMGLLGALRGLPAPWPEINLPNIGGALFQRFNKSWTKRNQGVKPADTSR